MGEQIGRGRRLHTGGDAGPVGGRAIGRGIGERGGRSAEGSYDTAQRENSDERAIGDTKHVETPRK